MSTAKRSPVAAKNESSPHATPASTVMDTHYALIELVKKWDRDRVLRLCGLLKLTRYELASLIALPHKDMEIYFKQGVFPGPVCLLLTLLENSTVKDFILDPILDSDEDTLIPFPNGRSTNT